MKHALLCVVPLAAAGLLGCDRSDEIAQYTVPSQVEVDKANPAPVSHQKPAENRDRMLAAIVPHGDQAWFFKVTGPIDEVADQEQAFRELLKSLSFANDEPKWTLPAGWTQKADAAGRFATLVIKSRTAPLEMSVMALPFQAGPDPAEYTLINLNRWRGQMGLRPIGKSELPKETEEIKVADATATFVDLVGTFDAGPAMNAPFAGGALNGN